MQNTMRLVAASVGCRLPASRLLSSRLPVVLTYHGVPKEGSEVSAEIFERQMLFLSHNFHIVSWKRLGVRRSCWSKVEVVLTFDDGFRNNAEVVAPILRRYKIPAVFFVSSRHAERGQYLWFSYLRAFERHFKGDGFSFRGHHFDMSPSKRSTSVSQLLSLLLSLRPHPAALYQAIQEECPPLEEFVPQCDLADRFVGMSAEQLAELAADPLFTIGIHTVDHPFLTYCDRAEIRRQIADNKTWIERHTGKRCELIAYPTGDFNLDVLEICAGLNIRHGFSVHKKIDGDSQLQQFRVGVYRESLDELGCKVRWGHLLTHMQSLGHLLTH